MISLSNFLKEHNIDNPKLTYLVGFSGGYDSMCLLHLLRTTTQNRIVALHLNHNWRGEESDNEAKICADFCKKLEIEFYSEKLSENIAHTETEARKARYDFFERCAKKFDSNIVFTAHNKNDQAETLIFRICHGTGVNGLQGILKHRDIYYRPILDYKRDEIEKYCQENNLTPNSDTSNKNIIYKRNLIRHEIMPKLAQINPNIIDALYSLAEIAKEETNIIKDCTNIINDNKVETHKFLELSDSLQKRVLYEIISSKIPENYDRERVLTIWNFIKENCNLKSGKKISITTDLWLFVNNKKIEIIENKPISKTKILINKEGEYQQNNVFIGIYPYSKNIKDGVSVDLSKIEFNFELRNRCDGDIIKPVGLNGTQKLKKYLNERKIPNHEKDDLIFLAQGKEILLAFGLGISDKIKITTKPTHKIVIKRRENGF